jgi:type II secretory pathway predicted ATPase ExeA
VSAAPETGGARDPFGLTANPDGYHPTAAIERVLADALAALEIGNVPVIAGPTGLGKTLVLQLIARKREPQARAIYVPFCTLPPGDLARLALGLLGVEAGADPEGQFLAEAQRAARGGGALLLLVDDAAALPGETAAGLASWLIAAGGALQIVLAGLPGAPLRHARDAFGDRAEDLLLVSGLRTEEVRGYVHARLAAAGAGDALRAAFDESALAELARVSEGNPRRMNLAAQAIARGLRAETEPKPSQPAPVSGVEAARAAARSTAQDLVSVGEYRFVRGRFVDPASGEAPADAPEVPHVEKPMAPLPPRRRAAPKPAYTPPLEIDRTPGVVGEPHIEVDEAPPPPVVAPAPVAPPARRVPAWAIAAAIGLVGFAVGAWWQLGGDEELPAARVTIEPMEIGEIAPPGGAPAPAAAAPEAPVQPAAGATPLAATPTPPATEGIPAAPPAPPSEADAGDATTSAVVTPTPDASASTPPEPAAPAPPPAPAETVPVAINATPWAIIEVDGTEIGETPLAGIELTVGRHRFRARMPDGSVREQVIRIDADNTAVAFE